MTKDQEDVKDVAEMLFTAIALFALLKSDLSQAQTARVPQEAARVGKETAAHLLKREDSPRPKIKQPTPDSRPLWSKA